MKRPLIIFFMLASLSIVILGFQSLITEPEVAVNFNDNVTPIVTTEEPVDIMLATDLHYLTDALIEEGPVFERPLKKSDFPENENPIKTHSQKRVNFS